MSIFEYNEEAHMKCVRQEGYMEGKAEAILELLEELGDVPEELRARVFNERDLQQLKRWLKLVAKAESLEQFAKEM